MSIRNRWWRRWWVLLYDRINLFLPKLMTYYKDVMDRIQEYQPELITKHEEREELYLNLHREETQERKQAEYNRNIVEAYDWLCDMVWTAYGVNKEFWYKKEDQLTKIMQSSHYSTICFKECREEVKRSNRTKSKEKEDWKIIKWPNYEAPNLLPIIKKYHVRNS